MTAADRNHNRVDSFLRRCVDSGQWHAIHISATGNSRFERQPSPRLVSKFPKIPMIELLSKDPSYIFQLHCSTSFRSVLLLNNFYGKVLF